MAVGASAQPMAEVRSSSTVRQGGITLTAISGEGWSAEGCWGLKLEGDEIMAMQARAEVWCSSGCHDHSSCR